jgi:hypothetical protein
MADDMEGTHMGALVTLDLPDDSPVLAMPWIITFGPMDDDEEWEPVVCGPYERAHALALAETVVADEQLMAVVEPLLPHATVDAIRSEIESNRAAAEVDEGEYEFEDGEEDDEGEAVHGALDDEYDEQGDEGDEYDDYDEEELEEIEPTPPPSPEEVRAGFARIAARLTSAGA